MNLDVLVYFHMASISFRKILSLLGICQYPWKSPSGTGDWAWEILSMNTRPVSCCSIGKQILPSCSACLFKGCEQLGPHCHPETLFCMYMSLECTHCHRWSTSQHYPKQCALRQYLWSVSSLPWGRDSCNEFLIWGYFSFFQAGSSFDEKVWIHFWGDIFLLLYVFGGSSCH